MPYVTFVMFGSFSYEQRGMNTLRSFSQGQQHLFVSSYLSPSAICFYSKGKTLLPLEKKFIPNGTKFFPIRVDVDPFSEGWQKVSSAVACVRECVIACMCVCACVQACVAEYFYFRHYKTKASKKQAQLSYDRNVTKKKGNVCCVTDAKLPSYRMRLSLL